ncbi:hypothetical protein EBZ37_11845, partial [bacterium]|nr:hypothetical protein [bacterium]
MSETRERVWQKQEGVWLNSARRFASRLRNIKLRTIAALAPSTAPTMFEKVEVRNGYVDACKGLEEAAGPDKNGKPRKGAVILANTIAAAKRDLRPLPEILEEDGVRLVRVEDFPDLLMA